MIKLLPTTLVHTIKAQQYAQSLFTITKELIENSLDANSLTIKLYLNPHKLTLIDDGEGIMDLINLGKSGYTSKQQMSEMAVGITRDSPVFKYGFRGTALFSLTSVSDVECLTSTGSEAFSKDFVTGKISKGARERGTTVTVRNLFKNCDIRRKNLEKNYKRDVTRIMKLVRFYCLVRKVNFIMYDRENVFYERGVGDVMEYLRMNFKDLFFKVENEDYQFYITGKGKGNKDSQFMFMNDRPVYIQSVSKEIMRVFNHFSSGCPCYVLRIKSDGDFNVDVDKMRGFIEGEQKIINSLKFDIEKYFSDAQNLVVTHKRAPLREIDNNTTKRVHLNEKSALRDIPGIYLKNINSEFNNAKLDVNTLNQINTRLDSNNTLNQFTNTKYINSDLKSGTNIQVNPKFYEDENLSVNSFIYSKKKSGKINEEISKTMDTLGEVISDKTNFNLLNIEPENYEPNKAILDHKNPCFSNLETNSVNNEFSEDKLENRLEYFEKVFDSSYNQTSIETLEHSKLNAFDESKNPVELKILNASNESKTPMDSKTFSAFEESKNPIDLKIFNQFEFIPNALNDNYHIQKTDLKHLQVLGQFNKGFILTKLVKDLKTFLIIVDQHAADEIYNYETLMSNFYLKKQNLIVPCKLKGNTFDEFFIASNLEKIRRNGFDVSNNNLTAVPIYKNIIFNQNDFWELLNEIQNCTGDDFVFCKRFKDIMASKACRSSVMIGDNLNVKGMTRIIENLSVLKVPWKCPHGRPVLRVLYVV